MAQTKSDNVQINISIPTGWKTELENLARIYSVEEGKTITFLDLMYCICRMLFCRIKYRNYSMDFGNYFFLIYWIRFCFSTAG